MLSKERLLHLSKVVSAPQNRSRRARRRLSAGSLAVVIMALTMAYTVTLLQLGLSVVSICVLVATLAGIAVEVVRRLVGQARCAPESATRRVMRVAAQVVANQQVNEPSTTRDDAQ